MPLLDEHGQEIKPTQTRVVVCIPSRGECKMNFTHDLVALVNHTVRERPDIVIEFVMHPGTLIHDLRTKIARLALERSPDYLFWLDDDMRFPMETLIHLLEQKRDIVGANYTTRSVPIRPTAKIVLPNGKDFYDVASPPGVTGLQEVTALGFGCILIRAKVFRDLEQKHASTGHPPWFSMPYSRETKMHIGEDVYFGTIARGAGFITYLDHDLSRYIEHIGTWEFNWHHYDSQTAAEQAREESPAK